MVNLEKLMKIQTELNVPKNQYNNFGKYAFRNCEDILEALKPLLKKYKCAIILNDKIEQIDNRIYITSTASLYDTEENDIIQSAKSSAREEEVKKGMDGAQITGAASSYARKKALGGLLAIDDNKDPDSNEYKEEAKEKILADAATKAKQKKTAKTSKDTQINSDLADARKKLADLAQTTIKEKILSRTVVSNAIKKFCKDSEGNATSNYNNVMNADELLKAYEQIKKQIEKKQGGK